MSSEQSPAGWSSQELEEQQEQRSEEPHLEYHEAPADRGGQSCRQRTGGTGGTGGQRGQGPAAELLQVLVQVLVVDVLPCAIRRTAAATFQARSPDAAAPRAAELLSIVPLRTARARNNPQHPNRTGLRIIPQKLPAQL